MSSTRFICAALCLVAACSSKSHDDSKERKSAPRAVAVDTEVRPLAPRPAVVAPEPPVPAVDPSRIAVEEDFLVESTQRITKRNDLELELQRLAKEIEAAPR